MISRSLLTSSQRIPAPRPSFSHAHGEHTRTIFVEPGRSKASAVHSGLARDRKPEVLPLPQYATLVGIFALSVTAFLAGVKTSRHPLPERIAFGDLLLLGVATHKISRLIAKDRVTSPFRAPFARFEKSAGGGEVDEQPRGTGMQRAIGDLVTCPYCVSPWVAAALSCGFVVNPWMTRFLSGIFSCVAISHFMHRLYGGLDKGGQAEPPRTPASPS